MGSDSFGVERAQAAWSASRQQRKARRACLCTQVRWRRARRRAGAARLAHDVRQRHEVAQVPAGVVHGVHARQLHAPLVQRGRPHARLGHRKRVVPLRGLGPPARGLALKAADGSSAACLQRDCKGASVSVCAALLGPCNGPMFIRDSGRTACNVRDRCAKRGCISSALACRLVTGSGARQASPPVLPASEAAARRSARAGAGAAFGDCVRKDDPRRGMRLGVLLRGTRLPTRVLAGALPRTAAPRPTQTCACPAHRQPGFARQGARATWSVGASWRGAPARGRARARPRLKL
jgi:hypothetical protein